MVFLFVLRIKDNNDLDLNFKYRDIYALDIPSKEEDNDFDDLDYIFDSNILRKIISYKILQYSDETVSSRW